MPRTSAMPLMPYRAFGLILLPAAFFLAFYFYPLGRILFVSLTGLDLPALDRFVKGGDWLPVLWFTFWQALVSTLLTLLAALPGAGVMARFDFPGKQALHTLATIPFVLPTVVVAAAFQACWGRGGVIPEMLSAIPGVRLSALLPDQSLTAVLAAHVFYNYAVVLRLVGGFWSQLPANLSEASAMLGATPWRTFRRITLPLLMPAILAAGSLVFIFCFSSFGVILILGGPRFATLEVEIYRQTVHLFNLPVAALLSLLQILFTFCLMLVYTRLQRRNAVEWMPAIASGSGKRPRTRRETWLTATVAATILFGIGLPLASLAARSLWTREGISLRYFGALMENTSQSLFFVPPSSALFHSLSFAVATVFMALILGTLAALFLTRNRSRLSALLDPLFMLPLSTSAVTLGFGFIISLDRPPLNLRTSPLLIPIAHCLVAFPFVVRALLPALRSIPDTLREAAALLGARPRQVWRYVDLPILSRAMTAAAVFAFTVSMGEFGATVFIARPQTPTLPLAIYRFLGQPGHMNYGQAMAMSAILMLICAAGFLIMERLSVSRLTRRSLHAAD